MTSRADTRYKHVWDAGYLTAAAEIDREFRKFLEAGGQIALTPFASDFSIRMPSGAIAQSSSLLAVMAYGSRSIDK